MEKEELLKDKRIAAFDKEFTIDMMLVEDPTFIKSPTRGTAMILSNSTNPLLDEIKKKGDKVLTQISQFNFDKQAVEIRTLSGKKHWYYGWEIKSCVNIANNVMREVKVIQLKLEEDDPIDLLVIKSDGFYLVVCNLIKDKFLSEEMNVTEKDDVEKSKKKQLIIRGGGYCI